MKRTTEKVHGLFRVLFSHLWVFVALSLPATVLAAPVTNSVTTGWLQHPDHPPVEVRLSLTGDYDPTDSTLPALLEVKLDGDWKTYWHSPGEGGFSPVIKLAESDNIEQVSWQWPAPVGFDIQGIRTVGYTGQAEFPLQLHLADNAKTRLQAILTLPTCTNICVLTDYQLNLAFDPTTLLPNPTLQTQYQQLLAKVPDTDNSDARLSALHWSQSEQQLDFILEHQQYWHNPEVYFHTNDATVSDLQFEQIALSVNDAHLQVSTKINHWLELPELQQAQLTITVVDVHLTSEYVLDLSQSSIEPIQFQADSLVSVPLLWVILFAVLGGLILNIMPCVLPVLGLKIHSLIQANSVSKSEVRQQFLAAAAGMLVSFWLLATGLLLLRSTGTAIGWGIQFQNPIFIGFMVLVTLVFTLNLAGAFEVRLPTSLNSWAASKGDNSRSGHFLQGMLATLLATPCTAPFLGTAVAFALAASGWMIFIVFTALGLGMALPWLAIAAFPTTARMLPKPGPWLGWIKPIFALLMFITTVWLTSLLHRFIEPAYFWLGVLSVTLFSLWLLGRRYGRRVIGYFFLALCIATAAYAIAWSAVTYQRGGEELRQDHIWQEFSEQALQQALNDNQTVFVDITADWCITCQSNKYTVLLRQPVHEALGDGIVLLRGDWTVPNTAINNYLHSNNTFGVPFNKVYGPAAPQGIELPTILTPGPVLNALENAQ